MKAFVGGHHGLKPTVGHLMHRDAHQAAQAAVPRDQGQHGVLHAAVASLNDVVFRIGIGADVFVDERHGLLGVIGQGFPVAVERFVLLVDQTKRDAIHLHGLFHEVGVCRPREVNHVIRVVTVYGPWGAVRQGLVGHLGLDAGGGHAVSLGHVQANVKVPPNAMEFASDVWVGVPAVVVEFAKPWVPLRHAVFHALFVHPTGAANLSWDLGLPTHGHRHGLAGLQRLGQRHFQDGAIVVEWGFLATDKDGRHSLPAPLVFRQRRDAAADAPVGVLNRPRTHIHHAAWLKRVEERVPKQLVQRLGLLFVYFTVMLPS